MMRTLLLLALTIVAADAQGLEGKVDAIFSKWDSAVSPGCALSVMKDGQIIYKRGYGMADLDHDVPIAPDTVFHVASISKQFTAAAILLLAQDGKLSLDDDVRKYITELPDFGARITLRHLIHHTSGLRDQWDLLGLAGWRYSLDLITNDDVLQMMSRQKELNFAPGAEHVYCNTGYTLLGEVVKRVSGQSLREFTTHRIFQPLGMKSTHFRDDHAEIVKHMAYGYVDGPYGYVDGPHGYRMSVTNFDTVGATSLLTTVEDLALWDENFYHPRVGGQALVEQQLERGKLNSGRVLTYAAGLDISEYRGLRTVHHGGSDAGYRADLLRFPDQHFSVACLCNKGEIAPGLLARKVADLYLAQQFTKPVWSAESVKPVAVPLQRLTEYAGAYWDKSAEAVRRVTVENGKLVVGRRAVIPLSESRFLLSVDPDETYTFEPHQMRIEDVGETPEVLERVVDFQPTPAQLAAYAGSYKSDEIDPIFRIVVGNGGLVLKHLKADPQKLRPVVEDYFQGIGTVHFLRDSSGKITGLALNTGRIRNFHFKKID